WGENESAHRNLQEPACDWTKAGALVHALSWPVAQGVLAMLRWVWLLAGIVLSQATPASRSENPQPPSAKEIEALIDGLVSPNPEPDTARLQASETKPDLGFPRDYDHKNQGQVDRACAMLTELGPRAFPFLIERWGDKRYCMTIAIADY